MPSAAREQAWAHDEMQAPAGVNPEVFSRLPDEVGHDAADMASLDDEALMRIAGECRRGKPRGAEAPPSIRAGKRASFRLKCSQVNASPKLPGADSASPCSARCPQPVSSKRIAHNKPGSVAPSHRRRAGAATAASIRLRTRGAG